MTSSSDAPDSPRAPSPDVLVMPDAAARSEPPAVRLRRELEAVIDIARAVSSTLHIDALLPKIMDRVTQLMKADRSTLFVVDAARRELWSKVLQGSAPQEIRLRIGDGVAGWVAEHGQSVNLDDVYADARFDKTWDIQSGYRTRSLLCVPIRNKEGQVVGVIQCLNKHGRGFDQDDELLLSCIGAQCAVAIENALLYEVLLTKNRALQVAEAGLRSANAELEVLYAVEQQLSDAPDLGSMIAAVLQRLPQLMGASAAALLLTQEGGAQVYVSTPARAAPQVAPVLARAAQTLVLHARFPIVRRADAAGGIADSLLPDGPQPAVRETLSVPLSDGQTQIGVLQLVNRTGPAVSDEAALRQLAQCAAQLGRGIVARREREAGERAGRLALLGHSVGALLHDMRTPLTAISGYVELMVAEDAGAARQQYAERVGRAIEHMESMTQEVLAFARGQREVLVRKVYLQAFIGEVRELLVAETQRFGVELVVDARYDGAARFDEGKCKRVLFNLARNACQAMGSGGRFTWTIDRSGETLVFECEDTGPGIPKEMEGRLFESFATHGKAEGTGLGLAMAKKIVDAHCGQISVRSAPGKGATFRIELPI